MKCGDVRKFIPPYLDSELDSKSSFEIEQHLESCAECAGLFEAEKKFDQRLSGFLHKGSRTTSLWNKIESQIAPAAHPTPYTFYKWWLAAAAALVLFAGGSFWIKARPFDLAKAAGECHSAYLHHLAAPELDFANDLNTAAFTYRPAASGFSSRGSRFCYVANVPCELIMGDYGNVPVSVIVFEKAQLAQFPQARERLESGDPVVCSRSGRFHFAMRLVDSHVVCVVGDEPRPVLEDLLRTVRREGG